MTRSELSSLIKENLYIEGGKFYRANDIVPSEPKGSPAGLMCFDKIHRLVINDYLFRTINLMQFCHTGEYNKGLSLENDVIQRDLINPTVYGVSYRPSDGVYSVSAWHRNKTVFIGSSKVFDEACFYRLSAEQCYKRVNKTEDGALWYLLSQGYKIKE